MDDKYDFNVKEYLKNWKIDFSTKAIITDNTLKISSKNFSSGMLNTINDCSGEYNINDITSIKYSSCYICAFIHIVYFTFSTLIFITYLVTPLLHLENINFNKIFIPTIVFIVFFLIAFIFSRILIIKITFKDKSNIKIPISLLFFQSIEYKENSKRFIEEIRKKINKDKEVLI